MWTAQPRQSVNPRHRDIIDHDVSAILGDRRSEVGDPAVSVNMETAQVVGSGLVVLTLVVTSALVLRSLSRWSSPDRASTAGRTDAPVGRSFAFHAHDFRPQWPLADASPARRSRSLRASASNRSAPHSRSRLTIGSAAFVSRGATARRKTGSEGANSWSLQAAPNLQAPPKLSGEQVRWLAMPTQATVVESSASLKRKPGFRGWAVLRCRELEDGSVNRCAVIEQMPARSEVGHVALSLSSQFRFQPPARSRRKDALAIEFLYKINIDAISNAR